MAENELCLVVAETEEEYERIVAYAISGPTSPFYYPLLGAGWADRVREVYGETTPPIATFGDFEGRVGRLPAIPVARELEEKGPAGASPPRIVIVLKGGGFGHLGRLYAHLLGTKPWWVESLDEVVSLRRQHGWGARPIITVVAAPNHLGAAAIGTLYRALGSQCGVGRLLIDYPISLVTARDLGAASYLLLKMIRYPLRPLIMSQDVV